MDLIYYDDSLKEQWDRLIKESRNGTFLFYRDYMEYHKERYKDKSIVFKDGGKVVAAFPANFTDDYVYSHGGLTYGGIVLNFSLKFKAIDEIFKKILDRYREEGFTKIIYKAIPYIYSKVPSEEDLYILFRNKSRLIRREISVTIALQEQFQINSSRRRRIRKAKGKNIIIEESTEYSEYWNLLTDTLKKRYNKLPVHSLKEISYLSEKFPNNIRLHQARLEGEVVAGVVAYENFRTCHLQYIADNDIGREEGALDLLISHLIERYRSLGFNYFDFGICTEDGGKYLNENLIYYKQSFGGTGVSYDTYEVDL